MHKNITLKRTMRPNPASTENLFLLIVKLVLSLVVLDYIAGARWTEEIKLIANRKRNSRETRYRYYK